MRFGLATARDGSRQSGAKLDEHLSSLKSARVMLRASSFETSLDQAWTPSELFKLATESESPVPMTWTRLGHTEASDISGA